jgi:hypothetical protein
MVQPITRRSFLTGLAAASAMLALPRPPSARATIPAPTSAFPVDTQWVETLAGLGDNEWAAANPHDRLVYQPIACKTCTEADHLRQISEPNPINRNWSDFVIGDGVVFNHGGGHNTHPGNDVDVYFIEANQWEVQYPPEVPFYPSTEYKQVTSGPNPSTISPQGRPWGGHTSQQMVFDPAGHRFIVVRKSGTWAYDLTTQWTLVAGPTLGTFSPMWNVNAGVVLYDANRDLVVAVSKAGSRSVFELDPDVDVWGPRIPVPSGVTFPGGNIYGASAPDRDEMYVFGYGDTGQHLYRYFPETHGWQLVTSVPFTVQQRKPVFDYDSAHGVVVFVLQPRQELGVAMELWVWDPEHDTWQQLPQTGVHPLGKYGLNHQFAYDAVHNVFIGLEKRTNYCGVQDSCGGLTRTWVYRLAP